METEIREQLKKKSKEYSRIKQRGVLNISLTYICNAIVCQYVQYDCALYT